MTTKEKKVCFVISPIGTEGSDIRRRADQLLRHSIFHFLTSDIKTMRQVRRTKLSADAGFHSEKNMKMVFTEEIDAYVTDNQYRKRDSRFADYDRYKERHRKERARHEGRKGLFTAKDLIYRIVFVPRGKGYTAVAVM